MLVYKISSRKVPVTAIQQRKLRGNLSKSAVYICNICGKHALDNVVAEASHLVNSKKRKYDKVCEENDLVEQIINRINQGKIS